jgi:hypothetical protein
MAEPNYLRAAFRNPYNLVLLGGAALLGLFNWDLMPLLLPVTAALEGIYLLTVPGAKFFRRKVNLEAALRLRESQERQRARALEGLSEDDRRTLDELRQLKQGIVKHSERHGDRAPLVLEALGRLDELIDGFVQMGLIRAECQRHLDQTDIGAITADLRRLEHELPHAAPQAAAPKQQNIEILRKRLERLGQIQDYVEVMAAQQKGIADTFHLLNDQLLTLGFTAEEEAGLISTEIDKLITGVGGTEEAVKKMSVDMSSVRRLLGELSAVQPAG